MGTIVANYSEVQKRFIKLGGKFDLSPERVRYALSTKLRYCLGGNVLYVPAANDDSVLDLRLCWARIDPAVGIEPAMWDSDITETFDLKDFDENDIRVGNRYTKRQKEDGGKFVKVESFCSQVLFDELAKNPEALPSVSPNDFEALCAEIFVRRGFKVDLFRKSKDGGIDFIAINDENTDPTIFAVQCKQPETRPDQSRNSVGRPVLQKIYGAAKAWDMKGGILISGSTYSREAKDYARYKPGEMLLYNQQDILEWIEKYRWNEDEMK